VFTLKSWQFASPKYSCCSSFLLGEVPNLKALADVMNDEYSGDQHGMIIKINMDQISNYFNTGRGGGVKPREQL
jgi:hypothetical protein